MQRHKCRTQRDGDYKEKEFQELTSISDKIVRTGNQQNSRSFISVMTAKAWYFRYDAGSVAMNGYLGMDGSAGFS